MPVKKLENDTIITCEYISTKDKKLIFKCPKCNKNYKKHFNKDLIKRFASTYEFCDSDIIKFCLTLRKGVYPYKYMESWKSFDETLLPDKNIFTVIYMDDITYADYKHAKNI